MSRSSKLVGAVAVLAVFLSIGFIIMARQPSVGHIVHGSSAADNPAATPAELAIDGKYIRFKYPSAYSPLPVTGSNDGLETYKLAADTTYAKQAVVAVSALPTMRYDDDASYHMRHLATDKYAETDVVVAGRAAKLMRAEASPEAVLFMTNKGLLATVALTSANAEDNLEADLAVIEAGFSWK